jgi:hypothetical protein
LKTAELTGALLDYWVAKAEGIDGACLAPTLSDDGETEIENGLCVAPCAPGTGNGLRQLHFSTEWSEGGPIIESEHIAIVHFERGWCAYLENLGAATPAGAWYGPFSLDVRDEDADGYGETALIAAMRAFVASKFGDEVPDQT